MEEMNQVVTTEQATEVATNVAAAAGKQLSTGSAILIGFITGVGAIGATAAVIKAIGDLWNKHKEKKAAAQEQPKQDDSVEDEDDFEFEEE